MSELATIMDGGGIAGYMAEQEARFKYPLLTGKKCRLRDVNWKEDYSFLRELFDGPGMLEGFGIDGGVLNTFERMAKYLTLCDSGCEYWLWVVEDFNGNKVGLSRLGNVSHRRKVGGPWMSLVHNDYRGQGLAQDMDEIVFRFGFDYLHLHKMWADIFSCNKSSLKSTARYFEYLHKEGVLRHEQRINGRWVDLHIFAIFEDDDGWKKYWI